MLSKVPAIPDDRLCQVHQRIPVRKTVDRHVLCAHGYSTWEVTGNTTCDLNGKTRNTKPRPLSLGVERATSGQGWTAVIARHKDVLLLSPWCVRLEQGTITLTKTGGSKRQLHLVPPSSNRAIEFLSDLCNLHDVGSQFAAALAATLTLPVHNYYRRVVILPRPFKAGTLCAKRNLSYLMCQLKNFKEDFHYYITMGCNPRGIMSNLCGLFWERGVPCNLVSAWLHPPLEEMPQDSQRDPSYIESLVKICAIRNPKIATLWLGAALSGLVLTILDFVRSGIPVLDPEASAWVGSSQSFIEDRVSKPPSRNSHYIHRADVWRLTYIDEESGKPNPPLMPWEPFGEMSLRDTSTSVRVHQQCRHHLDYRSWSWSLGNNSSLTDKGYIMGDIQYMISSNRPKLNENPLQFHLSNIRPESNDASEAATRSVFYLIMANGEGYAPSEEAIYNHEWIRIPPDSDGELPLLNDTDSFSS